MSRLDPYLCAAPAALVAAVVLAPFVDKAFTIDDATFLFQAEHVLSDPLHPTAFDMVYQGEAVRLSSRLVSGPVMAFLLVPAVQAGGAEWLAHLVQLLLLWAGLVATAGVALRLGLSRPQAAIAAGLVVASPPVAAMTMTAMPDTPAMALAALAIERLLAFKSERRLHQAVAAAGFLALATLARPHASLLIGVAWLWLLDAEVFAGPCWRWPRGLCRAPMLPVVGAVALLVLVNVVTRDPEHGRHLAGATLARMHRGPAFFFHLASVPLGWTLSFPLALAYVGLHAPRLARQWRQLIPVTVGAALALATPWSAFFYVVLPAAVLGAVALFDIVVEGYRRRDQAQLVMGLWLLIAVPTAMYDHLPVKYLVPAAPAMAILLARHGASLGTRVRALLASAALVVGLVVGVLVNLADQELAEIGRRGGAVVAEEVARGETVWMDGGWGFQWYAMRAGARALATTPPLPQPGDVVVSGPQGGRLQGLPRRSLERQEIFDRPGGRVLGAGAGFYSDTFGFLPWSYGTGEIGRIEVWRIEP
ncbi:MAG: hypothetical protein HY903_01295 [Deltaproteobacteria bacterium]|nr:hypothetical protein [Deltaproteobacteria bacterium]